LSTSCVFIAMIILVPLCLSTYCIISQKAQTGESARPTPAHPKTVCNSCQQVLKQA